jgi:hypothetical protein
VWFRHARVRSIGVTNELHAGRHQMPYRTMGWIHANLARLWRESAGQGTVEYVGLMLMLALLLGGVVTAAGKLDGNGLAKELADKLKQTIESVGSR